MDKTFANYILQKTQADYDAIAADFSATRAFPWYEMKDLVEQYVKTGERVLDAGCGNGRLYELVKDKKVYYEGIDGSAGLIAHAKKLHGDHFTQKNLVELADYPEGSFSIVFCIATFQHIPGIEYRKQVLQNFYDILVPGGKLIMINWNILGQDKFSEYLSKKTQFSDKLDKGDIFFPWRSNPAKTIWRYYHGFSKDELESLLVSTNFSVTKQYYTKHGQESDFKTGYNLVTVASKK